MDRDNTKNLGLIFDETVNRLSEEVRTLKIQQKSLTENNKDLESKRNAFSNEIFKLEKELEDLKIKAGIEAERITESARKKLEEATSKDAEASRKNIELNNKLRETENLTKSNQGLQISLDLKNKTADAKIEVLKNLVDVINGALKDL